MLNAHDAWSVYEHGGGGLVVYGHVPYAQLERPLGGVPPLASESLQQKETVMSVLQFKQDMSVAICM